jgi:hypothetical protein
VRFTVSFGDCLGLEALSDMFHPWISFTAMSTAMFSAFLPTYEAHLYGFVLAYKSTYKLGLLLRFLFSFLFISCFQTCPRSLHDFPKVCEYCNMSPRSFRKFHDHVDGIEAPNCRMRALVPNHTLMLDAKQCTSKFMSPVWSYPDGFTSKEIK